METHQKQDQLQQSNRKIDNLRKGSLFVEDDGKIANILNNCFARLGLYKGKDVSPNHSSLTFEGLEFSFRPVTRKELYNVIDNLPKHKSLGPGYIPAWALKIVNCLLELI